MALDSPPPSLPSFTPHPISPSSSTEMSLTMVESTVEMTSISIRYSIILVPPGCMCRQYAISPPSSCKDVMSKVTSGGRGM